MTVISLMALLSMNLGIVNLLPIPALDGGKIVLNTLKGSRKTFESRKRRLYHFGRLWVIDAIDGIGHLE